MYFLMMSGRRLSGLGSSGNGGTKWPGKFCTKATFNHSKSECRRLTFHCQGVVRISYWKKALEKKPPGTSSRLPSPHCVT